jgi:NADH-quinone oxidoreductase subunit F
MREGRSLKAIIPGGSSARFSSDQLDTQASYDGIQKAVRCSARPAASSSTTRRMVWLAENLLHFYRHESCGKCTPCREGTDWLHKILQRIERGEGQMRDLDLLSSISANIGGKTLCAFGDAAVTPVLTTLKHFRHEYEAHIREGRCTLPAEWRARHAVAAHQCDDAVPRCADRAHALRLRDAAELGGHHGPRRAEVAALLQQRLGPYLVGPGHAAAAGRRHHR